MTHYICPSVCDTGVLLLAYAAVVQPLYSRIRCCVEGSETTFELVYRAAVNDVRHGLGGSTDAQWVVGVTTLMETGCTSASAWVEMEVGTRHRTSGTVGSSMILELAGRSVSQAALQRSSVEEDMSMDHNGWRDGRRDTGWLKMSWWTGTW